MKNDVYPTGIFCRSFIGIFFVICLLAGCAAVKPEKPVYTAYNMWYEKPDAMWCINYKRGIMIPAGTEVYDITLDDDQIGFRTVRDDLEYTIHFRRHFHPGKTIRDYRDRMFTANTFEETAKGMSELEITAIREGTVVPGMSKKAVLVSQGYPPEHATRSLLNRIWTYWTSRHHRKIVRFNEEGLTY